MPKERKLGEVFKTPWGKLKVIEDKAVMENFAYLGIVLIVPLVAIKIVRNLEK